MLRDLQKSKQLIKYKNQIVKSDFASFIKKSFYSVNPSTKYLHNWHIDLIAEYLTACERGEIKRLIINIPPRSLKSISVSVAWPAWLLGHDPSRRIIAASYSQSLSLKHSLDCRLVMNSSWYRKIFPEIKIAADQNEKAKFVTTKRGFRMATSVGGAITGEGGNFLIVDDAHNPAHIMSKLQRESTLEWFDQTFASRLDDKKKGVFVIVMQRLHEGDLCGHLLKKGGWEHLSLSAIANKKEVYDFGNVNKVRSLKEILHSSREDIKLIEQAKIDLGSYAFSAQYQQNPVPISGGMIAREWLKRADKVLGDVTKTVQSWDTAIKANQNNDYSVCTTWQETEFGYFLVDVKRVRLEYPDLKRMILREAERYEPDVILIEDKASGQSLLQDLRKETKLALIAINPTKDKVTRLAAVSAMIEAGRVYLPNYAAWLTDLETELFSFPSGRNDDQVDSISQFLNWTRTRVKSQMQVRAL